MLKEGIASAVADKLADKLYEGVSFFFQTKIDELVTILPELAGIALIICGCLMMFGDLQKWLARTGIVIVVGTTLVVLL
ncbi:hypothetical protein [Alkalihalobacillus deserti]|uniref:hypothetical protein n=1 Tax=Alkalihalobacillus deserti TaxID=2879466 RepID=UPI001D14838A|nr:hypothetical protein [Alkalihalobacillus deserti]